MTLEIRPLTAAIGAEVHGIRLASPSDAQMDELHKAFLEYKVLFFRNQELSIEEHIAFGRRFGELEMHPFAPDLPAHPEIVVIESTHNRNANAYKLVYWFPDAKDVGVYLFPVARCGIWHESVVDRIPIAVLGVERPDGSINLNTHDVSNELHGIGTCTLH